MNIFQRTEFLLGKDNMQKLNHAKVAVFGVGGVGSFVVEALARSGVGTIVMIDKDVVDETNINRQIHATTKTIGQPKVEVMKQRILEINPDIEVKAFQKFFLSSDDNDFLDDDVDYIVDAIDNVTGKIALVEMAKNLSIPIIASLGTGNKLDPTQFEVTDIYKTEMCPLAKVMRKELKKRQVKKLKVVYSKELPHIKRRPPASIAFVPSVAGLIIAGEVIKDITELNKK